MIPAPARNARGPAGHLSARTDSAAQLLLRCGLLRAMARRCGLLGFTRVARPLPFSLAALRPHRSAPFLLSLLLPRVSFFFPGSFLSPAAVSAARMEGHRRHPHMAGDQSRPLPFLFPLAGRPINLHADPSSSPILCPLPRATAAGENPPLPSANADAKATRSTAGPPRARRYSPFRVLALFCPATPSPARLFSL